MVKIDAVREPSEEALNTAVSEELQNAYRFQASTIVSDYVQNLEASADVTNNLDLYYKD
jgi:peptidyl-prolyl cis-trans isomerase D